MNKKYLVKKLRLVSSDMPDAGSSLELEYYLIESELDYIPELYGKKVYGVGVVKKLADGCFEEAVVSNLFCNKNNVSQVVNKLCENVVTPISLRYVIEDMISA